MRRLVGQGPATFLPNYPHLAVLLQAARPGEREGKEREEAEGKKDVKEGEDGGKETRGERERARPNALSTPNCGNLNALHGREGFFLLRCSGCLKSEVSDDARPNELSYLPPLTYPARRGWREEGWGGGAKRDDYELS